MTYVGRTNLAATGLSQLSVMLADTPYMCPGWVRAYLCLNTEVESSTGSLVCESEVHSLNDTSVSEVDSVTLTGNSDCMSVVTSTTDCSVPGVDTSTDVAVSVHSVYCSNKRLIR